MNSNGSTALISVDGTDCPIEEPGDFSGRWFSHKFHGAGLRYEVGVCIQTGWIVWKNGPYPCGSYPDLTIARDWLHKELQPGEMYVADRGYRDPEGNTLIPTGFAGPLESMMSNTRARHENINARIKNFKILKTPFRNALEKHYLCFHSIINMIQLEIETGHPVQQVFYDDKNLV
jgi:DDE superfamily endonuclease